ncbi:hypothetical protein Dimus_031981 [Dionaea muscipula]
MALVKRKRAPTQSLVAATGDEDEGIIDLPWVVSERVCLVAPLTRLHNQEKTKRRKLTKGGVVETKNSEEVVEGKGKDVGDSMAVMPVVVVPEVEKGIKNVKAKGKANILWSEATRRQEDKEKQIQDFVSQIETFKSSYEKTIQHVL